MKTADGLAGFLGSNMRIPIRDWRVATMFWVITLIALSFSAFGQTTAVELEKSGRIIDRELESRLMKRRVPYRIMLPVNYAADSNKAKYYPTLYLLHGLWGDYKNWSRNTKLLEYTKDRDVIIVMPRGKNGWYTDSLKLPNDKYESYIVKELIPAIEQNYRVKKTRNGRGIAGLSMGGFGALKFGLKYPDKFIVAGSFSGALGAGKWTEAILRPLGRKVLMDSILNTFGKDGSETRKENEIFGLLNAKSEDEIKALPYIYLDCGTEDFLILENRNFAKILLEKKVAHEFRQLPGKHDWKFWDSQIKEFLDVLARLVK